MGPALHSRLYIFFFLKKIPLLTIFLWFWSTLEIKMQLLNVTSLVSLIWCSLSHILSSIKWNKFHFSLNIMLFHASVPLHMLFLWSATPFHLSLTSANTYPTTTSIGQSLFLLQDSAQILTAQGDFLAPFTILVDLCVSIIPRYFPYHMLADSPWCLT